MGEDCCWNSKYNFWALDPPIHYLDRETQDYEQQVRGGQAGQEGVGGGLEGVLLHDSEDDEYVATDPQGKCQAEKEEYILWWLS